MDYLLCHANNPLVSGDPDSMTWNELAMSYAFDVQSELRRNPLSRNANVSTLAEYATRMRLADAHSKHTGTYVDL